MSTGTPSTTAQAQVDVSSAPDFASIGVKNTTVNTAPGVELTPHQKLLVGSVLDLFEGRPSLKHLSLWNHDATFTDPLSIATTYPRFAAQWYGLPTVFHPIAIASHRVISAENPIELELRNKYTVKVIGKEQVISSTVRIFLDDHGQKITRVEDRWGGKLPEGVVSEAFRKLNAVTVPMMVRVPKTDEEDRKMREEREKA